MKQEPIRQRRQLLVAAAIITGICWFSQGGTSSAAVRGNEPASGQPKEQRPQETRVRALLKERLVALRELADTIGKTGNTAEIFRAKLAVLYAEFELCDSDRERLAVLEKVVAAAKQFEAQIRDAGAAVASNTGIRARLTRIDAELGLERFKATLKAPAK